MYIHINIGNFEFTFGKDRKGLERRKEDVPVEEEQRKCKDRRLEEPPADKCAGDTEEKGKN